MKSYYTKERLEKAVKKSVCISDVVRLMKQSNIVHGASHNYVKRKIQKFGICTKHFLSKSEILSKRHLGPKRTAEELLIKDREFIAHASQIRRALLEIGRPYKCESCGNNGAWKSKLLTLEIDHKDGNHSNDLPDNLRFLCPNCHSQTKNYKGKNRKNKA